MGTHYKGTADEVRALNAFIVLNRAMGTIDSRIGQHIVDHGLTEPQFGVLETLYHLGALEQHEIARKLLTSGGNITYLVDKLETAGYVERKVAASDRRCNLIHLTRRGRALIRKIFPKQAALITEVMGVLTANQQEVLTRLCKKLGLGNEANITTETT